MFTWVLVLLTTCVTQGLPQCWKCPKKPRRSTVSSHNGRTKARIGQVTCLRSHGGAGEEGTGILMPHPELFCISRWSLDHWSLLPLPATNVLPSQHGPVASHPTCHLPLQASSRLSCSQLPNQLLLSCFSLSLCFNCLLTWTTPPLAQLRCRLLQSDFQSHFSRLPA